MNLKFTSRWIWLVIISMLLASCASPLMSTPDSETHAANRTPKAVTNSSPTTNHPVSTIWLPTATSATIDIPTVQTSTFALISSPTVIPTQATPIPTLPAERAQQEFYHLIQENSGCRLPCFWGISPGKTSLETARVILTPLKSLERGYYPGENGAALLLDVPSDGQIISLYLSYSILNADPIDWLYVQMQMLNQIDRGYEIQYGNPAYSETFRHFQMPALISTYGQPDQVLVFVEKGWYQFSLLLMYTKRGFLVEYIASLDESGEEYVICPSKAYINMWLWDSNLGLTSEDILGWRYFQVPFLGPADNYLSIDETTDLTTTEFLQSQAHVGDDACFLTPKDIWPAP